MFLLLNSISDLVITSSRKLQRCKEAISTEVVKSAVKQAANSSNNSELIRA